MTRVETEDYCGCCGREGASGSIGDPWCKDCAKHVLPKNFRIPRTVLIGWRPPEDRTYYAQHKQSCPFQVGLDVEEPCDRF